MFFQKSQIEQSHSVGLSEEKHQSDDEYELIKLKGINTSCAVVAIVNWLVAFSDVLGIQVSYFIRTCDLAFTHNLSF